MKKNSIAEEEAQYAPHKRDDLEKLGQERYDALHKEQGEHKPTLEELLVSVQLEAIHYRLNGRGVQFLRSALIKLLHKIDGTTSTIDIRNFQVEARP